ncbi:MFS transporter [Streptomyces hundungensis]|uniref:MFS transporter n=1 Tax=Streptomyces hundungensis TaxID=1077946 RepID=UPI0033CB3A25
MIWRDGIARTMLGSMLISSIGMGLYTLALGQTLFHLTGDAQAFAVIFALQGLGAVLVLPFSGPLVDALDSQRVYLACSALRSATVALIFTVSTLRIGNPVAVIGTAAVFLAVFDNVQRTAFFKFTAHRIDSTRAVAFNSMIGIAIQTGRLAGMAALGLVLLVGTPTQALLVDVAMSLVAAGVVSTLPRDTTASAGATQLPSLRGALGGMMADWRQLFRRHRSELVVFGMIAMCAGDFVFSYSLSTLVVPLVDAHYGAASWVVSALEATFGAGMITATFFTRFTVRQALLPGWVALQGLLAAALAFSGSPWLHFPAYFLAGYANLNTITWLLTSLQQHAAAGDKAKMASLRLLAIGIGTAALMPLLGAASRVSLTAAYLTAAATSVPFLVCAVWAALRFRPGTKPPAPAPAPALSRT